MRRGLALAGMLALLRAAWATQPAPQAAPLPATASPSPAASAGLSGTAQALSPAAEAEPPARFKVTAQQVMARLLKAQASLAAFSCDVSREEVPEGAAPRLSQGTLKVKPGGRARFEIAKPSPQLLVSDGSTLWMALPEARQVFRQETRSLRTSGQFFLDLTSSIRYYSKNSQARLRSAGPGFDPRSTVALELTPKDPATCGFDKVVVWVDLGRWVILQGELTGSGTLVRAKFSRIHAYSLAQVKADPSKRLPDKLFHYQPPKGWEVFDSLLP